MQVLVRWDETQYMTRRNFNIVAVNALAKEPRGHCDISPLAAAMLSFHI